MLQGSALLGILADGQFHSGEVLGRTLGISRAGVWKHLQALKARGIEIDSVPGKGHRLNGSIELLSEADIRAGFGDTARVRLAGLELHQQIDSTNSELRRRAAALPSGFACLAEAQTAGRGRSNRVWLSPYARNLYLSLLWRFDTGPDALSGLSLAVGVAVVRALRRTGVADAGLKWPNDILWRDAKLAGTLIEMNGESCGDCSVVIGVGINVCMPRLLGAAIDQAWTDLASVTGTHPSRNRLAAVLLDELAEMLAGFEKTGLAPLLEEWRRHDIMLGREVTVTTAGGGESGIARGIDDRGALLVEADGVVRPYLSGDVSLRLRDTGSARAPSGPDART
ncbi:MAG: bifunctional biotin--[acetyl-CoA-carboxylase] ligase/biotin operon repressor BirA [Gammaproteobacteria bacterium]|nr:bifunctional biotin--[acetyl-CoA-carboxylase] ligase/biotin operon repressor BirA [Gammaproteobacteria bacterium]